MEKILLKRIIAVVLIGGLLVQTITARSSVTVQADAQSEGLSWDLLELAPDMNCINNVVIMEGGSLSDSEGIQLQWSYKPDFSDATTIYPSHIQEYTVKVKSPKTNQTMYCRVRGFIVKDGKKVNGEWSDTNSLKIVKLQKPGGFTVSNVKNKTIQASWKKVQAENGMKVRYVIKVKTGKEEFFWVTNKTSANIKDKLFKRGAKVTMSVASYVHPKNIIYANYANPRYWYGFNMMYSESKKIIVKK